MPDGNGAATGSAAQRHATRSANGMSHATAVMATTRGPTSLGLGAAACPSEGMPWPDHPTFDQVVDRFQAEIYRYATHLTRNHADADDLYQETLLKAYRAFDKLNGQSNHRAWLYKIATNTFLSDRRKRGRETALDPERVDAIPAAAADDAARLDARDLLGEVDHFVSTLPHKQRIALVGRKYHELSYGEIATILRCSEEAARASVHEALRKLRQRFGERL